MNLFVIGIVFGGFIVLTASHGHYGGDRYALTTGRSTAGDTSSYRTKTNGQEGSTFYWDRQSFTDADWPPITQTPTKGQEESTFYWDRQSSTDADWPPITQTPTKGQDETTFYWNRQSSTDADWPPITHFEDTSWAHRRTSQPGWLQSSTTAGVASGDKTSVRMSSPDTTLYDDTHNDDHASSSNQKNKTVAKAIIGASDIGYQQKADLTVDCAKRIDSCVQDPNEQYFTNDLCQNKITQCLKDGKKACSAIEIMEMNLLLCSGSLTSSNTVLISLLAAIVRQWFC